MSELAVSEAQVVGGEMTAQSGVPGGKRSALRLLFHFLAPYKALAAATLATLVVNMTGMLFVPTELSALVNSAVNMEGSGTLLRSGLAMLAAALAGSGGGIATNYLAAKLAANVGRDIRVAIYGASLKFSSSDLSHFGTGSMVTRTLSDVNVIQQSLIMGITMILPVPVMSAIAVALGFSVDAQMGWVLLGVTAAVVAVSAVAVAFAAPIFTKLQGFVDHMNTSLRENLTGVRVIRAFGKEAEAKGRLDKTFDEYATNAIRVNLLFSTTDALTFFVMNGVEALIMWLGANRVGAHAMQIGSITALIEYAMLIMFFMMMAQFAMLGVPRALACLNRAGEVLAVEPRIQDPKDDNLPGHLSSATESVTDDNLPGQLSSLVARFEHVSFRFDDADEDTLHNLDFSLPRGATTAIIGNTGSGKSTIAKLLLRFHDVTAGQLLVGGVDVRDQAQADLRARIAYVPQRAWLFSGTIAENLRHGRADATDEELWHALDVAQADFVRELPEGLGTRVAQGGTNFSGGQRQRLAIARALVRHADLYIFDDSFSALDFKTDAALRHALATELADAAVLIIAQRVSTIRDAAQIVVLKDGEIVGLGRHAELMETCPVYRAISDSQTKKPDNKPGLLSGIANEVPDNKPGLLSYS